MSKILEKGKMYRPTGIVNGDNATTELFVVEQYNHRVSKWTYTLNAFDFTLDTSWPTVGGGGTVGTPGTPKNSTDDFFNFPTGIVYDDPFIYVTDTLNHRIKVINAVTGAVVNNFGVGGQEDAFEFYRPAYIGFDPNNSFLIIADAFNHRVVRYDASVSQTNPTFDGVADAPAEGYHTPNGSTHTTTTDNYFVTDLIKGRVAVYNSGATNTPTFIGTPGTDSAVPSELFYPGQGHGTQSNIVQIPVFADTRNNEIKTVTAAGAFTNVNDLIIPGTLDGELYYPASVAGFFNGTVHYNLVANTLNNRVDAFDVDWNFVVSFGAP